MRFTELDGLLILPALVFEDKIWLKKPHCVFSPGVGSHVFDASGCQVGELWGTSGFEKLKIYSNCSSLCKRCKFCGGEWESGDHESVLGIWEQNYKEMDGCNSLKFLLVSNQFMENSWFFNQNEICLPKLFCEALTYYCSNICCPSLILLEGWKTKAPKP